MKRICHIISGLERGGAETTLQRLLPALAAAGFQSQVVSLGDKGVVGDELTAAGFEVTALGMDAGRLPVRALYSLVTLLRQQHPDIVQTWMYHADLLGGLAAKLASIPAIAWNIRHSDLSTVSDKRRTRWIAKSCALLSGWIPDKIICCADTAMRTHVAMGYQSGIMQVINNGFNTDEFKPDPNARAAWRSRLSIPAESPLIGLVARLHPQKGHDVLLDAAEQMLANGSKAHFFLCGAGVHSDNDALVRKLQARGLTDRFHLVGERDDMPQVQAALTIACSTSLVSEGFSNAIGEAMACGVPCVVSSVGESVQIVDQTGWVVRPGDASALAGALSTAVTLSTAEYDRRSEAARRRIISEYSLAKSSAAYVQLYQELSAAAVPSDPVNGG